MAIQRWDPLRDLFRLRERMNDLFEEVLSRSGAPEETDTPGAGWKPSVDLIERGEGFLLRADLPGVSPSAIDIEIDGSSLTLRGERPLDPSIPRESYLRAERPSGRFHLRIGLPPSVDRTGVRARHRDGVLEIDLPKRGEERVDQVKVDVG